MTEGELAELRLKLLNLAVLLTPDGTPADGIVSEAKKLEHYVRNLPATQG